MLRDDDSFGITKERGREGPRGDWDIWAGCGTRPLDEARRQAVINAVAGAGSEEERVKIAWAAFERK